MLNRNEFNGAVAAAGYTHGRLAEAIKMSKNTMSASVTGKRSFKLNEVKKICEVLKITDPSTIEKIFLN